MKLINLTLVTVLVELLLCANAQPFGQGLPAYCYGAYAVLIPACLPYSAAGSHSPMPIPAAASSASGAAAAAASSGAPISAYLDDEDITAIHRGTLSANDLVSQYGNVMYQATQYDLDDVNVAELASASYPAAAPFTGGAYTASAGAAYGLGLGAGAGFGMGTGMGFGFGAGTGMSSGMAGALGASYGGAYGASFGGAYGSASGGTYTVSSSSGGGGCGGCCCCCEESETIIQVQPVPVPVGVPEPVPQPPVIIEKILPPEIITTTTTGAPVVTSTQIIVKETVLQPITTVEGSSVLEAGEGTVTVLRPTSTVLPSSTASMFQPLPLCVPTGTQAGQIQSMLHQAGQQHLVDYQLLYAQRSVADQLQCSIALQRPSGVCEAYHLNSPLNQNAWSLGSVSTINCPSSTPVQLPYCRVGAF